MSSVLQFCLLVSAAQLALSSPVYFDKKLQEAEQIALESTGFLFPIDSVVRKIMRDLKSIRSEFTEAQSVVHRRKWIPGEVLVRGITDEQINMFNFGSLLVFAKACNPERLSERLMEKFGLRAEPNTSTGDAFTATGSIKYNPSKGDYTIEKGPGGISYPGYSNKAVWEFGVTNGKVNLKSSVKPGFQIVRKI
jgi:hypothetical protein